MSIDNTTELPDPDSIIDESQLPNAARQRLRQLENEQKTWQADKTEKDNLNKELALVKAGINELNEEQRTALFATHKGEVSPEALRETAERLKFVEPIPDVDPAVQAQHEQIAEASKGALPIDSKNYDDEIAAAKNSEELYEVMRKHGVQVGEVID